MVPPHELRFEEYRPERDGPLVECRYATAAYVPSDGVCARCGRIGCSHP